VGSKAWLAPLIASLALCAARAAEPILFRISVENVSTHFQAMHLRRYAQELALRAGPALKVEFYDGASLSRDADVLAALARGSAEMAAPGIWQFDRLVPDTAILMLPSAYGAERGALRRAVDGPLGSFLAGRIEGALPVKPLGPWLDLGYAHLFSSGRGIRSAADIAGRRIRVAGGRGNEERIRALGGSLVSIPSPDLAAYLERGLVDGILSTYETVATAGFAARGLELAYEDGEYYPFYVPVVSRAAWERLPERMRSLVASLWEELLPEGREASARSQEAAKAALVAAGMTIVVPGSSESRRTRSQLLAEEGGIARRLGVSDEALALLRSAFPGERR